MNRTMLSAALDAGSGYPVTDQLQRLVRDRLDRLPLPGAGATVERWQALALVGSHNLSLAKLYEGHTDALAILAELDQSDGPAHAIWGVWCAEPAQARLALVEDSDGTCHVIGKKAWCSGAHGVTHALISCWNAAGEACLAAVDMRHQGVTVSADGWPAVGMRDSASVDVMFDSVPARLIGDPGAYVARPGFWHGGAGVAACWYGAATTLAAQLWAACADGPEHLLRLAQLGEIDVALASCAALIRSTAHAIDRAPQADAMQDALRLRLAVDGAATAVLSLATRALGAGPLCKDARFAKLAADLPVFLRQGHDQRDFAALGKHVSQQEHAPWQL